VSDADASGLIADDESLHRKDVGYVREQEKATEVSGALKRRSTLHALKRALGKFGADGCTDLAAALTYYAVLSLFPALIALVSLLGVFGQGQQTIDAIMELLQDGVPESAMEFIRGPIEQLVTTPSAGFALIAGLVGALWTASGYVGAFSRALNRIYGVAEGRPVWKLRPLLLAVTFLMVVIVACAGLMLTLSGGIAESIFGAIGLGDLALTVWGIAKWPALLLLVVLVLAVLYQLTPNVRQPRFRLLSVGGAIALVVSIVGALGFGFYASNFGSYNATYGSLAGIIMFLLLLWITNNALLLGAEIDAELERARQLRAGIEGAEEHVLLPLRDESGVRKAHEKRAGTIAAAADIRRDAWAERARD
jgi:membrane protein